MRRCLVLWLLVGSAVLCAASSVRAEEPEDSLRIYTVRVTKHPPFRPPFTGFGTYLGDGAVLSAAHVVGRWPLFTRPRVLIDDLDLAATVVKMGSVTDLDITLLTVDEARLPLRMRMRRNPLCTSPPVPGEPVLAVAPDEVVRTHILSPLFIRPELRARYGTLITEVATASGAGIYRARAKCLLGIVSKSVPRYEVETGAGGKIEVTTGKAGYFVPAAEIAEFLPKQFRF